MKKKDIERYDYMKLVADWKVWAKFKGVRDTRHKRGQWKKA